ncbi:hypothetical protein AAY473_037218 [Plecturocebus cupreus]
MHFNTNERPQQAIRHHRGASSMGISISSGGDLETLPQQVSPHNHVASSIKSSKSSGGDLETLAQQALQCNCVVAAYIGNKDLETLTQQALQHDLMASFFTQSTVAKHSSQESTVHQAGQPDAVKLSRDGVASSIKSSSSSCGDLQTLAQQGLQCNCVVPAYIGNEDLETLTLQALQHNLMASSLTQRTTQSTVAQQSSQEATILQARRPEAELAWPSSSWGCRKAARESTTQSTLAQQSSQEATVLQARQPETVLARATSSWGCCKAARRCISVLMRGPNKPSSITGMSSSIVISISSRGDLETLPQQALPHNHVAFSIKSSTSRHGDLEILPQ